MRAIVVGGLLFAGTLAPAAGQDGAPVARSDGGGMTLPRVTVATVDWDAARAEAAAPAQPPEGGGAPEQPADLLTRLNAAAAQTFPGIGKSPVPVLLPVDTAALLRTPETPPPAEAAGFRLNFFLAGPAGYDAAFLLSSAGPGAREDRLIVLSATAILYDLDPPIAEPARPSPELGPLIPGIRRRFLESYLRYSFERFGVSYTVAMLCTDGPPRGRRIACAQAATAIVAFIKALHVVGGTPQPIAAGVNTIDRPTAESPDFTYDPPGRIVRNSGMRGLDGKPDTTVYARIRFPLAQAPAYANSQSFLNWGNCDFTGRVGFRPVKGAPYRCRVNAKPLVFDESAPENRSYPWRDNFCEHRRFFVSQCPGGEGHQGQDIRPAHCELRNAGADRCAPLIDDVVAARDATVMRLPRHESLYLYVNAPGEHLRLRYLHMYPALLDEAGLLSGRAVREGEVIGKVGNYDRIPNGTSYHLHVEIQVPTRDGWVFVNPYMTLVAAYERLIGGRGLEVDEVDPPLPAPEPEPVRPPDAGNPEPAPAIIAGPETSHHVGKRTRLKAASACTAKPAARSSGRGCRAARRAGAGARAKPGVPKLGRTTPAAGARQGRVGDHLRESDARPEAGHHGL